MGHSIGSRLSPPVRVKAGKLLTIDSQEEEDKFRQIVEPSVVYVLNLPVKIVAMIMQSVTYSILRHNDT